jgi:outer membrane protein OmpA-like peptidoglycan-associated protein
MKLTGSLITAACAAVLCGCAATAPSELVDARLAYQHASAGPAAELAPADIHKASEALARAEESFAEDSDSYRTRDLAYVAQRKAEMAVVKASIASEQKKQGASDAALVSTQTDLLKTREQDLDRTRSALAASQQSNQLAAKDLLAEKNARQESDAKAAAAQAALAKLASIKEEARGTVITLSGSVLFRSNESTLMPGASTRLDQVIAAFADTNDRNVMVEGYADSQGTDSYNLALSQRRADAVRTYLVEHGYPTDRVLARGMGEERPIADNATSEGRANNRRVEIVLVNPS